MSFTHSIQNFSSRCMHFYETCPTIKCTHSCTLNFVHVMNLKELCIMYAFLWKHAHPLYAHIINISNVTHKFGSKKLVIQMYARVWNMPIHCMHTQYYFCTNGCQNPNLFPVGQSHNQTCKCHSNRTWASKQQLIITTMLLEYNTSVCNKNNNNNNNNRPQQKAASAYHQT